MLHPDDTFDFVFDSDKALANGECPVLVYRAQSVSDWIRHERDYRAIMDKRGEDYWAALLELGTRGLLSWRNWPPAMQTVQQLADYITPAELVTLCARLPGAATIGELDRKKSVSPPPSSTAGCVQAVGVAGA